MFIKRDITQQLEGSAAWIQVVLGPRQCGKSTLLASLFQQNTSPYQEVSFDDLQLRQLANKDPALFLQQFEPPLLLDEVQYAPNLFPELKRKIDLLKRSQVFDKSNPIKQAPLFRLTGSNQILMDNNVKESLAGRASYYYLNTLSVHEILQAYPKTGIKEIFFKGGWPELYTQLSLSPIQYLNDYIRTYVEKDIALGVGIQKLAEFHVVLGLLAARTGQLLDYSDVANNSNVRSVTVKEWLGLLERADLVYLLKPYFNNLNKRLIKTPKFYFLDVGLAARLQGWSDVTPLLNSPQIGGLFETLVLAEIIKFMRNYQKDWQLYFWRTKDDGEIDFVIETSRNRIFSFEAKYAVQGLPQAISYPTSFKKQFSPKHPLTIVTLGTQKLKLSEECVVLPISQLHDHLQTLDS